MAQIRSLSQLSDVEFGEQFDAVRQEIDTYYLSNQFDKVFKGKWYACILHAELLAHIGHLPANRAALEIRLTPAVAQSLNMDAGWVNHFSQPLESLATEFLY